MEELSADDALRFIDTIARLTELAQRALPRSAELPTRLQAHLGTDVAAMPNSSLTLQAFERANLQLALNAVRENTEVWDVLGLTADIGNYSGVSLTTLASGTFYGPGLTSPQYATVDIGVDETLECLRAGIVLTEYQGSSVAVMLYTREHFRPELLVEVVASTAGVAESFIAHLRELMERNNVRRGKTMSFAFGEHGDYTLTYVRIPEVGRDDVVLPAADLQAIEQHAIGISDHAVALRAAGQHVKRGLLLYGPPGTGKTHTVSYLINQMPGRTTVILAGPAVAAVGQAGTIARHLQPATIIIEDVDLIGMDRESNEHNPLLFQMLNEMDGLNDDADVLFILTTNRVDLLEPALSARPGRIDQAIEIGLPDPEARHRLITLYVSAEIAPDLIERVVGRTEGVAAAFIKELARRAVLRCLQTGERLGECLEPALDAMLEQSAPILRRSLAAAAEA
jgi:cell division protease FtsH